MSVTRCHISCWCPDLPNEFSWLEWKSWAIPSMKENWCLPSWLKRNVCLHEHYIKTHGDGSKTRPFTDDVEFLSLKYLIVCITEAYPAYPVWRLGLECSAQFLADWFWDVLTSFSAVKSVTEKWVQEKDIHFASYFASYFASFCIGFWFENVWNSPF